MCALINICWCMYNILALWGSRAQGLLKGLQGGETHTFYDVFIGGRSCCQRSLQRAPGLNYSYALCLLYVRRTGSLV